MGSTIEKNLNKKRPNISDYDQLPENQQKIVRCRIEKFASLIKNPIRLSEKIAVIIKYTDIFK